MTKQSNGKDRPFKKDERGLKAKNSEMHLSIKTLRKLLDKGESIGVGSSAQDLLIRGLWAAIADVLPDGAGEQQGLLAHQAYVGSQPMQLQVSDVMPIQKNLQGADSFCSFCWLL